MRRLISGCIVWASLVLAACGNKDNIQAGKPGSPNAGAPAASNNGANAGSAEPASGDNNAAAVVLPKDIPSETDDGQESVDQTVVGLQPTFKLGGQLPGAPTSTRFKDGVHYQKIVPAQPTSVGPDQVEVLEVFWYGCGSCFALDPAIDSWRTKLKQPYVEFVRLPAMSNEAQRLQARVFYTAEQLGKLEELHALLFREVNVKSNPLDNVEKIGAFFREHGVATDEFQKAFSSAAVDTKLQRAEVLNRRLRVQTTPALVINGKYRTSVDMAGGEQQLFTLLGEIASHEHGS